MKTDEQLQSEQSDIFQNLFKNHTRIISINKK
jgi:hypothetical protein